MMKQMSLNEAKEVCEQIIEAVAAVFVGNKPLPAANIPVSSLPPTFCPPIL